MNEHFDVIVLGGGPGGTPAALKLAAQGKKVLLAEKSGKLGGACLFVGCIPSKIIKYAADRFQEVRAASPTETLSPGKIDDVWVGIRRTMDRILASRSDAAIVRAEKLPNLTFRAAAARFISSNAVELDSPDASGVRCTFDKAIIATGSIPFLPEFGGTGTAQVLKSEMLFQEKSLPRSMVIIGGGPIAIELSQMLTKLGVKCSIIEIMDTVLKGVVEPEFARELIKRLDDDGIDVHTSSTVSSVNRSGDCFETVYMDANGQEHAIQSQQVMAAVGRVPNVIGLDLKAAGISHDRTGIAVNPFLETNVPGIYATGDVIPGPKFAHTATYEALIATANILQGNTRQRDFSINSWVLFSDPEIASVGLTEAEAVKNGFDVLTGIYDYKIDAAAQITGHPFGYLKFVVEKKSARIIGVHVFTEGAGSVAGEAALIVANGLTLHQVAAAIHPHPTLTEAFGFLARDMLGRLA